MGVNVIKLREPANLLLSTTFTSAGVPCRGAASVTFLLRAVGDSDTLASITIERSNEALDGWQTSLPAILVEVGDALAAQTLNNATGGAQPAGRCRMVYAVAGGIPFRALRINCVNGAAQIDNFEVWAIVVDDAGDPGISAPRI